MSATTEPAAQAMPDGRDDPAEADVARPDSAPYLPAPIDDRPAFLTRDTPLIDTIPDRWVAYIANTVAITDDAQQFPITRSEIGMMLEVAARYALDPFAKEIWLAKSKKGKLLMMVARDGLRKIAQRNGLHVDGDVVHENDTFEVVRAADGNRTVAHTWKIAGGDGRGKILGAWAEVREGGPLGKPMGFFWAPLSEYKPAGAADWSVWGKQTSVMILGAAERTAIRQATPLGGLVAFGEHESAFAKATLGEGIGSGEPAGLELGDAIEAVLARAAKLGHHAIADRGMVEMRVADENGKVIPEKAAKWIAEAAAELDAMPQDAEVVEPDLRRDPVKVGEDKGEADSAPEEPSAARDPDRFTVAKDGRGYWTVYDGGEPEAHCPDEAAADTLAAVFNAGREYAPPTDVEQRAADELGVPIVSQGFLDDGPPRKATPAAAPDPERIAELRRRGSELLSEAEALRDRGDERADEVFEEFERLAAEVESAENMDQGSLPL